MELPFSHNRIIPVGLSVAAVIVAGLVAWTIITAVSSRSTPLVDTNTLLDKGNTAPDAPITSLIGKITVIGTDAVTIHALPQHNPELRAEREIVVQTSAGTRYVLTRIPVEITGPAEDSSSLFRSTVVHQSELQVGDTVNVRLGMEYDDAQTVTAESIEITRIEK